MKWRNSDDDGQPGEQNVREQNVPPTVTGKGDVGDTGLYLTVEAEFVR